MFAPRIRRCHASLGPNPANVIRIRGRSLKSNCALALVEFGQICDSFLIARKAGRAAIKPASQSASQLFTPPSASADTCRAVKSAYAPDLSELIPAVELLEVAQLHLYKLCGLRRIFRAVVRSVVCDVHEKVAPAQVVDSRSQPMFCV
eukprot:SAG31_NODE_3083_length_4696_cov_3.351751_4_plen_148_part_00